MKRFHQPFRTGAIAALLVFLCGSLVLACNVPVFRYALERWEPDEYELVVFHRQGMTTQQQEVVDLLAGGLRGEVIANRRVVVVDLENEPASSDLWQLWQKQVERHGEVALNAALPWLAVQVPMNQGLIWSGPLNRSNALGLVVSPARHEVIGRLLQGDSAVWVIVHSGQEQRALAQATLEPRLRRMEQVLTLPDGSFDWGEEALRPDAPTPRESHIPLKLAFSTLYLDRDDPAEQFFIDLLMKADGEHVVSAEQGPLAFPIFGRGRALGAVSMSSELDGRLIEAISAFLIGPCSCQVKALNPGADMLFAVDWEVGVFEQKSLPQVLVDPQPYVVPLAREEISSPAPALAAAAPPWRPVGIATAALVVLLTGVLVWRRHRP